MLANGAILGGWICTTTGNRRTPAAGGKVSALGVDLVEQPSVPSVPIGLRQTQGPVMVRYTSPIAEIVAILAESSGTAKQKLLIGGKLLSAALMFADDWSPASVAKANRINALLLDGRMLKKAVKEMTEHTAKDFLKRFSAEIADLAAKIEQAQREKRTVRTPPGVASSRNASRRQVNRR